MDTSSGVDFTPTKSGDSGILRRDWKQFSVSPDTFRKFQTGKSKFARWSKFLDEGDETHREIKDYAQKNPKHTVVLRCNETGALRQIRRSSANGL